MDEKSLAILPVDGFVGRSKFQSSKAFLWMDIQQKELGAEHTIKHAGNGGEAKIGP